jgi:hypothetical protein
MQSYLLDPNSGKTGSKPLTTVYGGSFSELCLQDDFQTVEGGEKC